jgi:hypothetical protein
MHLITNFLRLNSAYTVLRPALAVTLLCFFAIALTGCSLNFGQPEGESVASISGAPIVEIAAPLPNSTFLQNVAVNILSSISNAGADIQRVEISVNDEVITDLPSPNPSGAARFSVTQTWTPDNPGEYTVTVTAYRADGTSSPPATVQINVIEGVPTSQATEEVTEPTATRLVPTATATLSPTQSETEDETSTDETDSNSTEEASTESGDDDNTGEASSADSDDVVIQIVEGGINVRRGPSTNFQPPLGVVTGEVTALAANNSLTWFKINYQGGEAWITGDESLVTVVSGDPESLPRESGPPIPTLAPPTAPPAATATAGGALSTAAPTGQVTGQPTGSASGADLVVSNFVLEPRDPFCNQPAQMRANLANIGNAATATGGFVILAVENTDGTYL